MLASALQAALRGRPGMMRRVYAQRFVWLRQFLWRAVGLTLIPHISTEILVFAIAPSPPSEDANQTVRHAPLWISFPRTRPRHWWARGWQCGVHERCMEDTRLDPGVLHAAWTTVQCDALHKALLNERQNLMS